MNRGFYYSTQFMEMANPKQPGLVTAERPVGSRGAKIQLGETEKSLFLCSVEAQRISVTRYIPFKVLPRPVI